MIDYRIAETDDYTGLVPFFIENELEFTDEDLEEVPTDLVKCWKATLTEGPDEGKMIGAFVLAKREGCFICDGIAVDPQFRGYDIGTEMLRLGLEETEVDGGQEMYLVARAPEFFRKNGFKTIGRDEAPNFFECLTCPQYQITCHPEVMVYEIKTK